MNYIPQTREEIIKSSQLIHTHSADNDEVDSALRFARNQARIISDLQYRAEMAEIRPELNRLGLYGDDLDGIVTGEVYDN